MSKPIFELVNGLPKNNITILMLRSLDFAVPGKWDNVVGFENTIREVTGETDDKLIQQIGDRAVRLYNDKSQGYQRAVWLYQTVDSADAALGTAALASKVGEKVPLLGFLDRVTPKPDKAQGIDLSLKLVVELVAFCHINGIPGDSIGDFLKSLADYGGTELMRMAAMICMDGLVPLGPDFTAQVQSTVGNLSPQELEKNNTFKRIQSLIPGGSSNQQLNFINRSFDSVKGWMDGFVRNQDLSREKIFSNLKRFVELTDDKLDYAAAFLDMSTNYCEHTGIQTVARQLIDRAYGEI